MATDRDRQALDVDPDPTNDADTTGSVSTTLIFGSILTESESRGI